MRRCCWSSPPSSGNPLCIFRDYSVLWAQVQRAGTTKRFALKVQLYGMGCQCRHARPQPATCSRERPPGTTPSPVGALFWVPQLARWAGERPSSGWSSSTKKAVWCQSDIPTAFRDLAATESLPDALSPHLECLRHWHCPCFSSLYNLDTKFYDTGTLLVKDLLISQRCANTNDLIPAEEWFLKQFVVTYLVSLNFAREVLLFFSFSDIECTIFNITVVKWWVMSKSWQGIVSTHLL